MLDDVKEKSTSVKDNDLTETGYGDIVEGIRR